MSDKEPDAAAKLRSQLAKLKGLSRSNVGPEGAALRDTIEATAELLLEVEKRTRT